MYPGPLTNVMEEPAVELPLLDGPGIRGPKPNPKINN